MLQGVGAGAPSRVVWGISGTAGSLGGDAVKGRMWV